jgi:7,8-dihydropterin-6-yl-methyl-4-(beta-D-ribofuranosyl)aminobenzene 5'-phosphate synthase
MEGVMKITTLVENHPNKGQPGLKAEHGVSFYIEKGEHAYMSDLGQGDKFARNATALDIDLKTVEVVAISHYHYDHGGGLGRFFRENDQARVYLRAADNAEYIATVGSMPVKYIGLDRGLLKNYVERIIYIEDSQEVAPGLHLITHIPATYPKPHGDHRLKKRFKGETKPDTFAHEMVTVIEAVDGLVILTGCAHNGVLNMIEATRHALPGKPIQAVIGGFHLHHEDSATIREVGQELFAWDITRIFTGHCTGDEAIEILADVLGDRLRPLYTGLVMEF